MLKNIPVTFTPDLLRLLMAMGHGEELLISDGNFPALTCGQSIEQIYLPVTDIPSLLKDILYFFPLDDTSEYPLRVMESAKESGAYDQYSKVIAGEGIEKKIGTVERFEFYRQAELAAGIVITSSMVKGGNILLKKGVVHRGV